MRYILYVCIACVLYGCNDGVLTLDEFTFVAPEGYDGPISLPTGYSTGHYYMRMVGDQVARIDISLVHEHAPASESLLSSSQQCVLGGMKGRGRSRTILAKGKPKTIDAEVPGTIVEYTASRKGASYVGFLACLSQPAFSVLIAFEEPARDSGSDRPAVSAAVSGMRFRANKTMEPAR